MLFEFSRQKRISVAARYYFFKERVVMNTTELIKQLPGSWGELTLQQYQRLGTFAPELNPENPLDLLDKYTHIISLLSGVAVDELESLPFTEMTRLIQKVAFMNNPPEPAKGSTIQWKKLNEVSYDDFITFINLSQQPLENLHTIIKAISKIELTEEQVLKLSMEEVMTGFQLLQKLAKKSVNNSIRLTAILLLKQTVRDLMKHIVCKLKPKGKSK